MQTPDKENAPRKGTVIGGGAFGTAMGMILARRDTTVSMLVRDDEMLEQFNKKHENERYLKGYKLPENMVATKSIEEAVAGTEIVLLAIPTQFLRKFLMENRAALPVGVPIVACAKGIEMSTLQTPYEMMLDELPGKYHKNIACLAGPSFAKEIMEDQPTNVVVAANRDEVAKLVQEQMSCKKCMRCYTTDDVMGAEIAGAVKNVLAIASGASDGMGFGSNPRAALVCRGLKEMTLLALAMGSNGRCMSGLAGVGDLMLTCSSTLSRNFTVGKRLASGETLDDIRASTRAVAEGVATAQSIHELSHKLGVEMPICEMVYRVLYEKLDVKQALAGLQARALTDEGLAAVTEAADLDTLKRPSRRGSYRHRGSKGKGKN